MNLIQSAPELYAHAIAIEREAAERYAELAERMDDEGREDLARVYALLAATEAEHLDALEQRTAGIELPAIAAGQYAWFFADAPETPARELIYRLMTPRQSLCMALDAERRALAFFEQVCWSASDPALRALAREMAAEEREHVALIGSMVNDLPAQPLDTTVIFE